MLLSPSNQMYSPNGFRLLNVKADFSAAGNGSYKGKPDYAAGIWNITDRLPAEHIHPRRCIVLTLHGAPGQ